MSAGDRPAVDNPAGQAALRWRVSPHATALQRMREDLAGGAPDRPAALRPLAHRPPDDPAIALLDAWAVVCDVVSFYTERIADEGLLRTATERRSIRELARTLGYELRPGVAAQVELAFEAETAAGAPAQVPVPAGTPVQSVPGAGELPQTFETGADLDVRGAWNRLPARAGEPQAYSRSTRSVWLTGTSTPARVGDHLLVVGRERISRPEENSEVWDFRTIEAVAIGPDALAGWIRLDLDRPLGHTQARPLVPGESPEVHLFTARTRLFGHNAPDPSMLVTEQGPPPGSVPASGVSRRPLRARRAAAATPVRYVWSGFALGTTRSLELDGDQPTVLPGTWIVLEQPEAVEALLVRSVVADGLAQWGLSGPITRTLVDLGEDVGRFNRRRAKVHCGSIPLPAAQAPRATALTGDQIDVVATDPPLPPGRLVLVTGVDDQTGETWSEALTVVACEQQQGSPWMRITVDAPLTRPLRPDSAVVYGNVVTATHGETVRQVLGSGGAAPWTEFRPRRAPLTYVRALTPEGAAPEVEVRVDGVAWHPLPGLDGAGPAERGYLLQPDEDGGTRIVFGDGVHGARVPTGAENVEVTYRVGIGEAGAVEAEQISLLPRRPLGIRAVGNRGAAHDWAPAEELEDARINAPLRIRTLDRAVSVADHADLARGFAGVGPARADLVWDGRASIVLVSLLGVDGADPSPALVTDVRLALDAARDPGQQLVVRPAEVLGFGVLVAFAHHPDHRRDDVTAAVAAALLGGFGRAARPLADPVSAAAVLAAVRGVPGVLACTMPVLTDLDGAHFPPSRAVTPRRSPGVVSGVVSRSSATPTTRLRTRRRSVRGTLLASTRAGDPVGGVTRRDRLFAAPGRFEPGSGLLAAQLWALNETGIELREMTP